LRYFGSAGVDTLSTKHDHRWSEHCEHTRVCGIGATDVEV